MPDQRTHPTMFGGMEPAHLPDQAFLADLARAVVLGGEGGTLTLLGPHTGPGDFRALQPTCTAFTEHGVAISLDLPLLPLGSDVVAALDQVHPYWQDMVGVYVSPRWEPVIQMALEQSGRLGDRWRLTLEEPPMHCQYVWPNCAAWPDGSVQDGFWLEGNLDQARALAGRLGVEHQIQLRTNPCLPFGVLVSRDATHRIPLDPYYPVSQQWSTTPFIQVPLFEVPDLNHLPAILEHSVVPVQEGTTTPPPFGTAEHLQSLPFEQFLTVAAQVMRTFGVEDDIDLFPDSWVHAQGFLDLGPVAARGVLPILLSAHVEQRPITLTAETVHHLRTQLHPGMPGMIITTGDFSEDAEAAAYDSPFPPIALVPGTLLTQLIQDQPLLLACLSKAG